MNTSCHNNSYLMDPAVNLFWLSLLVIENLPSALHISEKHTQKCRRTHARQRYTLICICSYRPTQCWWWNIYSHIPTDREMLMGRDSLPRAPINQHVLTLLDGLHVQQTWCLVCVCVCVKSRFMCACEYSLCVQISTLVIVLIKLEQTRSNKIKG